METHFYKARILLGVLLIFTSRCSLSTALPVNSAPRIGIVGGGIGGASTAYFARNLFGRDAKIDVYEKSRVGGRLSLIEVADQKYEAGGSIIHKKNRYMSDIASFLHLKHKSTPDERLGIYNGKEFVFEESRFSYLTYIDLVWRYGLSIMKMSQMVDDMLRHFDNVYHFQDDGYAYTTVDQLLNSISPSFVNMTQTTTAKFLQALDYSDKFIEELVMAAVRVNYGQTTEANGLVGALSLSASENSLWAVEGGNYQLAEGALNLSKANVVNAKVDTITLLSGGKFKLSTSSHGDSKEEKEYDIVIVAAPQTKDQRSIIFDGFSQDIDKQFTGHYHQTVATFVQGVVNNSYFGYKYPGTPEEILTNTVNLPFNSISRNYAVGGPTNNNDNKNSNKPPKIYKIFSQEPMSNEQLDNLFKEKGIVKSVNWLAYPHYAPPEKLGNFKLHNFLYYTSAIEWAGSAMEMSAIAGRNAALLAYNEYNDVSKIDKVYTPKNLKTEL